MSISKRARLSAALMNFRKAAFELHTAWEDASYTPKEAAELPRELTEMYPLGKPDDFGNLSREIGKWADFTVDAIGVPYTGNQYAQLHDMLSDMIEGGRLTEADIPDDYEALVQALAHKGGS